MSLATNKNDLEAEIRRLEEELQRKKLQDEIAMIEEQLKMQQQVNPEEGVVFKGEDGEEYIVIEEIVSDDEEYIEEEYYDDEEEVIEEEIVEDDAEEEAAAAAPVQQQAPPVEAKNPPSKPANSRNTLQSIAAQADKPPPTKVNTVTPSYPPQIPLVQDPNSNSHKIRDAPTSNAAPRKQWVPLSQRKPELFKASQPNIVMVPGKNSTTKPGSRPPIKFTPRKIPNLPATNDTPLEALLGPKLITTPKGLVKMSTYACLKDQALVGLYFAAGWRTECKQFNPLLSDFYKIVNNSKHNIEIVYVPADRTLFEFKDVYARLPFLAMPAGTTALKNQLTKQLKVVDMPALIIMDPATGQVVTTNGVQDVSELENRNADQANELAEKWKAMPSIPIDQITADTKLKNGNLERKDIYWQE